MSNESYLAMAEAQSGGITAVVDGYQSFDPHRAEMAGVDLGLLLVTQPADHEEAAEITSLLIQSKAIDTIIVHCPAK